MMGGNKQKSKSGQISADFANKAQPEEQKHHLHLDLSFIFIDQLFFFPSTARQDGGIDACELQLSAEKLLCFERGA